MRGKEGDIEKECKSSRMRVLLNVGEYMRKRAKEGSWGEMENRRG